ncbi:MAG: dioxygenase [Pseudomonas sp.]|uniref:DODA-type extradiol aromatic ring-opening family dioxygenase n=1 Tax=Pseudomonas sp. TaxID=306 RepID=UPI00122B099F|nr:class III extradiol ring-cleavage dioxygenase [Pseudomonas sp.]RZI72280.1 MAG: dioxygenase [Pseudomonas sp.]
MNTSFPLLFVSHGAPSFAIEPGLAGEKLAALGRQLPQPDAIVILSPHWITRDHVSVTASMYPKTIHDFGGFPDALYELSYPAPGAPELASHIVELLQTAGWDSRLDPVRGLDHGAWVPLRYLAPDAGIPVVQVSMPAILDTRSAWELGLALKPLREMNVLIVASGSLTHNLYEFRGSTSHGADYVKQFAAWTAETLHAANIDQLLDYKRYAPSAERAHPTDEHFLPLFIALGAAGENYQTQVLEGGITHGVLAMDSYLFTSPAVPFAHEAPFTSVQPVKGVA